MLIPPGHTYGRLHALKNEEETLVEFYDCSVNKEAFPEGQFVSRYNLQTLCTNDFGSSLKEMAASGTSFCLDYDIPAWRIKCEELEPIADWLEQAYKKERKSMEREKEPEIKEEAEGIRREPVHKKAGPARSRDERTR